MLLLYVNTNRKVLKSKKLKVTKGAPENKEN